MKILEWIILIVISLSIISIEVYVYNLSERVLQLELIIYGEEEDQ